MGIVGKRRHHGARRTKEKDMKKLLVLGMAVALASVAFAFPTQLGPTGGVLVPDCAIAEGLSVTVFDPPAATDVPQTQVLFGLMENLEVGFGFQDGGAAGDTMWSLNAKYALPIDLAGLQLAAGAIYADAGNTNPMALYLSGCYAMAEDINIVGTVLHFDPDTAASSEVSLAVGVEKMLDNGKIGAEVALEDYLLAANTSLNVYADMSVNDALTARLAYAGIFAAGADLSIALQYAFGQ
ncbi:MAG: hypothetical protein BWY76_01658 [bacterium ADurb.Bin429]|nr:MAG: hypothetical protein BWY76_01658 [bacterium ADurb.Bin429]